MAYVGGLVRVFVSSTFGDLKQERDALQRTVFPRLRALCAASGLRFEGIDLRWGVSEEASLDQQASIICMDEIRRSQQTSPRPNFIILLGDRYGSRLLPTYIPASEFEIIYDSLLPQDQENLRAWYRRDDNAVPTEYCLQPRVGIYSDYDTWAAQERKIRSLLIAGMQYLPPGTFDATKYLASITEQEILAGALAVPDASEHVHCFFRTISGLPADTRAGVFADLSPDGHQDTEALAHLQDLKRRLRERLPGNIHDYQARWLDGNISYDHIPQLCEDVYASLAQIIRQQVASERAFMPIARLNADHEAFGEERRRHFLGREAIRQTITEYLTGQDPHPLVVYGASGAGKTALIAQVAADAQRQHPEATIFTRFIGATADRPNSRILLQGLCQQIGERFPVATTSIPDDLRNAVAILSGKLVANISRIPTSAGGPIQTLAQWLAIVDQEDKDEDITRLSRVHSDSRRDQGALVSALSEWLSGHPSDVPEDASSVVVAFVRRLSAALSTIPTDDEGLAEEFSQRLKLATPQAPLMIFLDALDQLEVNSQQRTPVWLPVQLPPNVRLIASTLPDANLTFLQPRLPATDLIQLGPMSTPEGAALLDRWLEDAHRTLQDAQRTEVLSKFAVHGLPLYLRLAFEESRRWKSYTPVAETNLNPDIPGIITDLFARLSLPANHGEVLVSRALGYFGAAKDGLSEDELLDILSSDKEVLADFQRRSPNSPHADYLPVIIWSRLYFDLNPYLTEREMNGASLLTFYHRQLAEVVRERYLSGEVGEIGRMRHRTLARYFADLDRQAAPHQSSARLRRLAELPYQQTMGALWDDLYAMLTDFDFLQQKATELAVLEGHDSAEKETIIYTGVYEIQDDFFRALQQWPADEKQEQLHILDKYSQAINREVTFLARRGDLVWQQMYNHLQWADEPVTRTLGSELESRRGDTGKLWFRMRTRPIESRALIRTLNGHTDQVVACAFSPDGTLIVSAAKDNTLRVWNTRTGQERFLLDVDGLRDCVMSPDGAFILSASASTSSTNGLKLWDVHSLQQLETFQHQVGGVTHCAYSADGSTIVSTDGVDLTIWDARAGTARITIKPGDWGDVLALEGDEISPLADRRKSMNEIKMCALSPDGLVVFAANDYWSSHMIRRWDVRTAEELAAFADAHSPFALSDDGSALVSLRSDQERRNVITLWDVQSGDKRLTFEAWANAESGRTCAFSSDGARIATGTANGVILWDTHEAKIINFYRGHTAPVTACAFSPDGSAIVSAGEDNDHALRLWDARAEMAMDDLTVAGHGNEVHAGAFSPDGATMATASDDYALKLWDTESGAIRATLEGAKGVVRVCKFSPDGAVLASASYDDRIRYWDTHSGELLARFDDLTEFAYGGGITGLAFSPDGSVFITSSQDRTVQLRDARSGQRRATLTTHNDEMLCCAFSPGGTAALAGAGDGKLEVFDLVPLLGSPANAPTGSAPMPDDERDDGQGPGERPDRFFVRLRAHTRDVSSCAFSPDGALFASASLDGTVKLWSASTGEELHTLIAHSSTAFNGCTGCLWSPDGAFLFSVGEGDRMLKAWDVTSGKEVGAVPLPVDLYCLAIHPYRPMVMCAGKGNKLYCLDVIGVTYGPLLVTPLFRSGELVASCPACGRSFTVMEQQLGQPVTCPTPECSARLRLNPFAAHAHPAKSAFTMASEAPDMPRKENPEKGDWVPRNIVVEADLVFGKFGAAFQATRSGMGMVDAYRMGLKVLPVLKSLAPPGAVEPAPLPTASLPPESPTDVEAAEAPAGNLGAEQPMPAPRRGVLRRLFGRG
jgi:WD40 repeat protein